MNVCGDIGCLPHSALPVAFGPEIFCPARRNTASRVGRRLCANPKAASKVKSPASVLGNPVAKIESTVSLSASRTSKIKSAFSLPGNPNFRIKNGVFLWEAAKAKKPASCSPRRWNAAKTSTTPWNTSTAKTPTTAAAARNAPAGACNTPPTRTSPPHPRPTPTRPRRPPQILELNQPSTAGP